LGNKEGVYGAMNILELRYKILIKHVREVIEKKAIESERFGK